MPFLLLELRGICLRGALLHAFGFGLRFHLFQMRGLFCFGVFIIPRCILILGLFLL
jgi:hypothetical protein